MAPRRAARRPRQRGDASGQARGAGGAPQCLAEGRRRAEADPKAMLDGLLALATRSCPSPGRAGAFWKPPRRRQAGAVRGRAGRDAGYRHGTYPFVTSSNTVAGQAATGAGTGPTGIGFVRGSPRPIRRGSEAARSRPRLAPTATGWASAGASSAPSPGASAAAAGSTR